MHEIGVLDEDRVDQCPNEAEKGNGSITSHRVLPIFPRRPFGLQIKIMMSRMKPTAS